MLWKYIERAGFILGLVAALATLYYTAGLYYGWNTLPAQSGALAGVPVTPPLWIIGLGLLGVLLLLTAVGMLVVRTQTEKRNEPSATPTSVRLQFQPDSLIPICLDIHNVFYWYALRHGVVISEAPSNTFKQGRQIEIRHWTIFLVFDKPAAVKQITVNGNGAQLPVVEVKDRGSRHAIITFGGDIGAAIVDITAVV